MWNLLRLRLEATELTDFEDRPTFLARLRRCARWLNDNSADQTLAMCTNQKERAKDVRLLQCAKTKW